MDKKKVISIVGILTVLATIVLFFTVVKDRIFITWLGFSFILVAEIILFKGLILIENYAAKTSQIVWRAGGGFVVIAYALLSILISIIYMISVKNSVVRFISFQIFLIIIAAAAMIICFTAANKVKRGSDKVMNSVNELNRIINKIDLLRKNNKGSKYSKLLDKLYDELRYSDISTYVTKDNDLEEEVNKLEIMLMKQEKMENDDIIDMINEMLIMINDRKIEVKNEKFGGV